MIRLNVYTHHPIPFSFFLWRTTQLILTINCNKSSQWEVFCDYGQFQKKLYCRNFNKNELFHRHFPKILAKLQNIYTTKELLAKQLYLLNTFHLMVSVAKKLGFPFFYLFRATMGLFLHIFFFIFFLHGRCMDIKLSRRE